MAELAPSMELPKVSAPPPKDKLAPKPTEAKPQSVARGQLEKIAKGTPVAEALSSTEHVSMPDREKMTATLTEANKLLLDLKDIRLLLSAVATQAADTPLGRETQVDVLKTIRDMKADAIPPEKLSQLTALQDQIKGMNLPEVLPESSALLTTVKEYNAAHPDKAVPQDIVSQIASGQKEGAATVAQLLQTNPDVAQTVWKQLTGIDGFTGLHPTPQNILELSGIAVTAESLAKAKELFGNVNKMSPQEKTSIMDQLYPAIMKSALILMFFTQMASSDQQSGGGH